MAIRDMFSSARQLAKQKKGCIVFVDEIDAITGSRIQSANSHHETLNQLLVELDGFNSYDNIMFLAATNSLDRIDPALLRPGRFDRHILVPLPSYKDRLEIINICLKKKHFKEKDIDLEELVAMTEGLSGAQIVNIFNESAILSIRYKRDFIDKEIIFEAFDRTLMGPPMTSYNASYEKKLLIAYHEAGHAVIGMSLPETIVKKITIIPR